MRACILGSKSFDWPKISGYLSQARFLRFKAKIWILVHFLQKSRDLVRGTEIGTPGGGGGVYRFGTRFQKPNLDHQHIFYQTAEKSANITYRT
jgi:hypothetical protein